jgi:hypothetical protein
MCTYVLTAAAIERLFYREKCVENARGGAPNLGRER